MEEFKMKKLREMKKNNKGFSLVELIVVIAIMVVLIAVLGSSILGYVEKSKYSKDMSALDSLNSAVKAFAVDPSANYDSGHEYKLNQLMTGTDASGKARDPYNIIKNALKETFPDGAKFASSSSAFKDLTTSNITVKITDGAVSIYVPSKDSSNYAPYAVGDYKTAAPTS